MEVNNYERLKAKVAREYSLFREKELAKAPEDIFNDAYRIQIVNDLYFVLSSDFCVSALTETEVRYLADYEGGVIRELVDYYIDREFTPGVSCDQLIAMIHDYLEWLSDEEWS